MKCTTCRKLMNKAQQDHLSAAEQQLKAEHLQSCRVCQALWEKEKLLTDTLHALPTMKAEDGLNQKMWSAIQERSSAPNNYSKRKNVFQASWVAGTVAVVGCFFIIWMVQSKKSQQDFELPLQVHKTENGEVLQKADTNIGVDLEVEQLKNEDHGVNQLASRENNEEKHVTRQKVNRIESSKNMQQKQVKQTKEPEFLKPREDELVRRARIIKNNVSSESKSVVGAAAVRSGLATIETDIISEKPKIYKNKINLNQQERTRFVFGMMKQGNVQLTIYSRSGKRIKTLVHEHLDQGQYQYEWNGSNESGSQVGTGIYFMVFSRAGDKVQRYKIVVLR